jgi:hypothetical protein
MSTITTFDLARFTRAAVERDAATQLSMYGPDATVTIADKLTQPGSPRVLRTHDEIKGWLEDTLKQLKRAEKRRAVDGLDARQRDRRAHQLGDSVALDLVERFEYVDALGDDEVSEQQLVGRVQCGGGASRHLRRIAGQVTDQNIRIDKRAQRRRSARSARVRRRTSAHGVPRLAAGTGTLPASFRKSGVLAITARDRSTRNSSSSPSCSCSASRTLFGIVTWPFEVIFALESIIAPY